MASDTDDVDVESSSAESDVEVAIPRGVAIAATRVGDAPGGFEDGGHSAKAKKQAAKRERWLSNKAPEARPKVDVKKAPQSTPIIIEGVDKAVMGDEATLKKALDSHYGKGAFTRAWCGKEGRVVAFASSETERTRLLKATPTLGSLLREPKPLVGPSTTPTVVIKGVDPRWSDEELTREVGLPCKRLVSGATGRPTFLVKVACTSSQQKEDLLKTGIQLDGTAKRAERYHPAPKPLQCFKCQGFGHTSKVCKEPSKCVRCSLEHSSRVCPTPDKLKCANCGQEHAASHFSCPAAITAKESKSAERLRFYEAARKGADPVDCSRLAAAVSEILCKTLTLALKTPIDSDQVCRDTAAVISRHFKVTVPFINIKKAIINNNI
jgi:hypothetical protein